MTTGLPAGTRLGRYQLVKRLALGGMAELYLARQLGGSGFEKVVAIKRVLPHLAEDAEFVSMFLNEARLAAGLDHSNIAHVMDFGNVGREYFMAMEYVHGRSVYDLLRSGRMPMDCALTIVCGIASALHYAHARAGPDGRPLGLVHRDVSPSNVLVSYAGDVKLVDFGIAKATAQSTATRTGRIKGKLAYMAPEQIRGEEIDRRADIFSLGIVAYELTTGQRCFYAGGEFALINRVAEGKFEPPSAVDPEFPPKLQAVIMKALSVDPDDRFDDARQLRLAIEDFANDASVRISSVAMSDYMLKSFGAQDYPITETFPKPTHVATQVGSAKVVAPAEPSALRRIATKWPRWWVAAALVVGLGLGIGVSRMLGGDGDEAPAAAAKAEAPVAPAAGATQDPSAPPPTEPGADDIVVSDEPEADDGPGTSVQPPPPPVAEPDAKPEATPKPSPRKRAKSKKKKPKKTSKPSGGAEYLPPSRREQ